MWEHRGRARPGFAIEPAPGQESVWDYPRPPALVDCAARVVVTDGARVIGDSVSALRVLETASPPTVYIPPGDIDFSRLREVPGSSFCEWKGQASYYALAGQEQIVGWTYRNPLPAFVKIQDFLCFYPGRVTCTLDGEIVRAQSGDFYGGWVTDAIVGPFKGDPGTGHW
jgi:uncharacterized protein (DUF427 family)